MKSLVLSLSLFLLICSGLWAQSVHLPVDTLITTEHQGTFNGKKIDYLATVGMQPLWDDAGRPIVTLNFTYYRQKNGDAASRPLLISFNGGPGSASVWMHIAYTGPKLLNMDDEGYPTQPYGYRDNPHSILDVADILYVNPVNTGYSRMIPMDGEGVDKSRFFGVNADINYLSDWLNTWVSRHNRWASPKYLIGESYGGTRVAGLAGALQSRQWMYLNGVIQVSPADYRIRASDPVISGGTQLPYFTAAAWYHKALPEALQQQPLEALLEEVEAFTIDTFMPALVRAGSLSKAEREQVAEKVAWYSGLKKEVVLQHNLDVPNSFFWKELLREREGYTVGRLDSRYKGLDTRVAGDRPESNSELIAWLHAFAPAINMYMKEVLGFETDLKYNVFGPVRPWDFENNNVRQQLTDAMNQNPFLHLMVQSGYFDGATNYFQAKYSMWQVNQSGRLGDRMRFKGYPSGHMMYLRAEDLAKANQDLRDFIRDSQTNGKPAKY
jgi:carboxypeptidase C (cathepsin A)